MYSMQTKKQTTDRSYVRKRTQRLGRTSVNSSIPLAQKLSDSHRLRVDLFLGFVGKE